MDHRFSRERLAAVGTAQIPVGVVFDDARLVTLDEMAWPSLEVSVKEAAAVCAINLDRPSPFPLSHFGDAYTRLRRLDRTATPLRPF